MKLRTIPGCALSLCLLVSLPVTASGQVDGSSLHPVVTAADSSSRLPATASGRRYSSSFRPSQLVAPGVLIAGGAAIRTFAHDSWDLEVQKGFQKLSGGNACTIDDYFQHAPLAMAFGLDLLGVKAEHGFMEKGMEIVLAQLSMLVLTRGMKQLISSRRPNGGDKLSFPSGHTSYVFCSAELVRMEYGAGWGAAAYGFASGVAFMRLYGNRHWLSDVLAGAGIGILCAHVGGWLLEPVKKLVGIDEKADSHVAVAPTLDAFTGTVGAALCLRF